MFKFSQHIFAVLFFLTWLASACSTEVDINAPGDPVPIVYCFLDPDASVQYVRLGQTWSIQTGDSILSPDPELVMIEDEIMVYLVEEISPTQQVITWFNPDHILVKDTGWFSTLALQIYSAPCRITPDQNYSLYVHFLESNIIVHGQTRSMGKGFDIIDPDLVPGRVLTLFPGLDYFVRFTPVINGSIFQSTMTFNYLEILNGIISPKSLDFNQKQLINNDPFLDYYSLRISGERFYIDISRIMEPADGIRRIPLSMDFQISAGGDDLALKIRAENDAGSFSILEVNSFDNAVGIFSTLVHKRVLGIPISHFMIDSLAMNALTRNLGFVNSSALDSLGYEIKDH